MDKFAKSIKNELTLLWRGIQGGDDVWTTKTFQALKDIGKKYEFESRYNGEGGEFLWDFIWYKNSDNKFITQLIMAAESEWTHINIEYDFMKLLVTSAPLRLMIFQAKKESNYKKKLEKLFSMSQEYQNNPGFFITACWIYGENQQHSEFDIWNTFMPNASKVEKI